MRFRFIAEHHTQWRVEEMCRTLQVSRSGFYTWVGRPPSTQAQHTRRLDARIRALFAEHRQVAGSPKLTEALRQEGEPVSRTWIAQRMQILGLRAKTRRKFQVTTDSRCAYPIAPNRLQRRFQMPTPNQVWVSDITYITTQRGWSYMAVFGDVYSRGLWAGPSAGRCTMGLSWRPWTARCGSGSPHETCSFIRFAASSMPVARLRRVCGHWAFSRV